MLCGLLPLMLVECYKTFVTGCLDSDCDVVNFVIRQDVYFRAPSHLSRSHYALKVLMNVARTCCFLENTCVKFTQRRSHVPTRFSPRQTRSHWFPITHIIKRLHVRWDWTTSSLRPARSLHALITSSSSHSRCYKYRVPGWQFYCKYTTIPFGHTTSNDSRSHAAARARSPSPVAWVHQVEPVVLEAEQVALCS